jgi:hypothetical protein
MKILAISLALGDIYDDLGDGALKQPADGGIDRFHRLVDELSPIQSVQYLIVCTAGFSKRQPCEPVPERKISLSDQLRRYVTETFPEQYNPVLHKCLHTEPLCWGTRNEIEKCIEVARMKGFKSSDDVIVMISSHWSHLPRVRLCAKMLVPVNWRVRLLKTNHPFQKRDQIREIPAFIKDARCLTKHKTRNPQS